MEKGVPPHPFPCLFCGVSGLPGNQEPEVPPPRVPNICKDKINLFEDLNPLSHFKENENGVTGCSDCDQRNENSIKVIIDLR